MTTRLEPKPIHMYRKLGTALALPAEPAPSKIAREDLLTLRVTAGIASDVCAEVLAVLEREGLPAHSIAITRETKRLTIEIALPSLEPDRMRILLRKIRPIEDVRTATLLGYEAEE